MEIFAGGKNREVVITRKRIKNLHMRIGDHGELKISCPPRTPVSEITAFILSRQNWIIRAEKSVMKKAALHEEGSGAPVVWWLGEKKYCSYAGANRDYVIMDGDVIIFYLKDFSEERITKAFRKAAEKKLLELAEKYRGEWDEKICRKNRLPLPEIRVRHMTSRWGVCKPADCRITLSTRLIHYPEEAFRSVLLHEYVHFLVRDHSARFYRFVYQFMPEYEAYQAPLK